MLKVPMLIIIAMFVLCEACCKLSKSNDNTDDDDEDTIGEETATVTTEKSHNYFNVQYFDSSYGKTWMFFPDGNGVPQVAYLSEPPSRKADPKAGNILDKIRFDLYTRDNQRFPKTLRLKHSVDKSNYKIIDVSNVDFNPNRDTKILVHGWKSSGRSENVQLIKDNYLEVYDVNVIAVDWEEIAGNTYYFAPVNDIRYVGQQIARLIDLLVIERGANVSSFHIIGHSLGAHTAGYAASFTKSGRISRVTGLDPAMPGFELFAGPESRLDPTDAEFVDVIHTCGGTLGYKAALGHVDFYPNGGSASQPGCNGALEIFQACSHGRAFQYFAESIITDTGFFAYPCKSWSYFKKDRCTEGPIIMGDDAPSDARGVYYTLTDSASPYAYGVLYGDKYYK